jgi:hypothetical protein
MRHETTAQPTNHPRPRDRPAHRGVANATLSFGSSQLRVLSRLVLPRRPQSSNSRSESHLACEPFMARRVP